MQTFTKVYQHHYAVTPLLPRNINHEPALSVSWLDAAGNRAPFLLKSLLPVLGEVKATGIVLGD